MSDADVARGLRKAETALEAAIADCVADGMDPETAAHDLIIGVAHGILMQDNPHRVTIAREFCRTQFGYIPQELEPWLGRKDWLDG